MTASARHAFKRAPLSAWTRRRGVGEGVLRGLRPAPAGHPRIRRVGAPPAAPIAHDDPILNQAVEERLDQMIEVVGYIDAGAAEWVSDSSDVMRLLRRAPMRYLISASHWRGG
jgi:hypothetical protein